MGAFCAHALTHARVEAVAGGSRENDNAAALPGAAHGLSGADRLGRRDAGVGQSPTLVQLPPRTRVSPGMAAQPIPLRAERSASVAFDEEHDAFSVGFGQLPAPALATAEPGLGQRLPVAGERQLRRRFQQEVRNGGKPGRLQPLPPLRRDPLGAPRHRVTPAAAVCSVAGSRASWRFHSSKRSFILTRCVSCRCQRCESASIVRACDLFSGVNRPQRR